MDILDKLIEEAKQRGCVFIKLKNYCAAVTSEDLEDIRNSRD